MIEIMFVNKMDHFYSGMHAMGLWYTKQSEGSLYYNGTRNNAVGNAVPPGGCFTYKWLVPVTSALDRGHDSCIWSYHPYVSMYQDQDTGSYGPVIVYNPGTMESIMGQNREFVLLYGNNQEWNSFLALHNVHKYLPEMVSQVANQSDQYPETSRGIGNYSFWYPQLINTPKTNINSSIAANFFRLNGYIYASNPPFKMCLNDSIIWYLYDMGFDTHVFHMHGENVVDPVSGATVATYTLNSGQMVSLSMTATDPGWWQLLCHFTTHLSKGMEANYIVYGGAYGDCPLEPLQKL